jgi:hypothetical protein
MTFAVGDLSGGVKGQDSGDAGMAGQGQAGQTSRGLSVPGRQAGQPFGAVTTVTLAIQVAAQAATCARGQGQRPSLNVIRCQGRRVTCRLSVLQQVWIRGYCSQSLSFSSACLINGRVVTCSCWSRSAVFI